MGTMTLAEELATDNRHPLCRVCQFLQDQAPEAQAEWREQMSRPATVVGNRAIQRALQRRGVRASERSVIHHRQTHQ